MAGYSDIVDEGGQVSTAVAVDLRSISPIKLASCSNGLMHWPNFRSMVKLDEALHAKLGQALLVCQKLLTWCN